MENNNTKKTIGNRINTLLANQRKTQKSLADELGVKPNVISYFCKGERTPNTEQLVKIARFFNVSADYLLGISGNFTTDDELKFVCNYTGLSDEAIKHLRNYLVHYEFAYRHDTLKAIELEKYVVNNLLSCENFWHIVMRLFALREYTKDLKSEVRGMEVLDMNKCNDADVCRYMITKEIEKISDLFDGRVKKEASNNGDNNTTDE